MAAEQHDTPPPLAGFDLVREPGRLVIRPNVTRPRDGRRALGRAASLMTLAAFASVFAYAFGFVPVEGEAPAAAQEKRALACFPAALALGLLGGVALMAYSFYADHVRDHLTPIVLDLKGDRLLHGERLVCRLSDVRSLQLRRLDTERGTPGPDETRFGVCAVLKDYTLVPRRPASFLGYPLGPQQDERSVERAVRSLAAELGVGFCLESKRESSGGGKGMGG